MSSRHTVVAALAVLVGCGGGGADPLATRPECNPLGGAGCMMPFPSALYLRDDATSPTGVRLDFPPGALPTNIDEIAIQPDWFNARTGFSANSPIIVAFGVAVDPATLPPIHDPGKSLEATSPTVVVDMTTNERVPHFAEVDVAAADEPEAETLIIRPVVRLQPNRRYAVGVRRSLGARGGGDLPVPWGFAAIRDGKPTEHARLERVRPRYDAIFASLAQAGVPKEELVTAWDFVTADDESVRRDMLLVRDLGVAEMDASGQTFQVTFDGPSGDPAVTLREVKGRFTVPLFLTDGGGDTSVLARDGQGDPTIVGAYEAPFWAIIPTCAATAPKPLPVVVYGHGLMGSGDEIESGYVRKFANYLCVVVVSTDWRGMSSKDIGTVALALNDANHLPRVMERLPQGILSYIGLARIVRHEMAASPVFTEGGEPLLDPTRVTYYGISQGGIFGGTFMAYDPFVTRGVLNVGAMNYSMMLERSSNWPIYELILGGAYPALIDRQVLIALMQLGFDLTDPATITPYLLDPDGPVPGSPPKQILMQMAVGDSQVPNIASETQARAMGLPLLGPSVYEPYGLPATAGPLPSAFWMMDLKIPPAPPPTNSALQDNGVHGLVRKRTATNDQIREFLFEGRVVQTCTLGGQPAACDCTVAPEVCGPEI